MSSGRTGNRTSRGQNLAQEMVAGERTSLSHSLQLLPTRRVCPAQHNQAFRYNETIGLFYSPDNSMEQALLRPIALSALLRPQPEYARAARQVEKANCAGTSQGTGLQRRVHKICLGSAIGVQTLHRNVHTCAPHTHCLLLVPARYDCDASYILLLLHYMAQAIRYAKVSHKSISASAQHRFRHRQYLPLTLLLLLLHCCRYHYTKWWPMHKEKWRWIKDGARSACNIHAAAAKGSKVLLNLRGLLNLCMTCLQLSDNVARMFAYFFPFVVAKNGGLWFPGDLQFSNQQLVVWL